MANDGVDVVFIVLKVGRSLLVVHPVDQALFQIRTAVPLPNFRYKVSMEDGNSRTRSSVNLVVGSTLSLSCKVSKLVAILSSAS